MQQSWLHSITSAVTLAALLTHLFIFHGIADANHESCEADDVHVVAEAAPDCMADLNRNAFTLPAAMQDFAADNCDGLEIHQHCFEYETISKERTTCVPKAIAAGHVSIAGLSNIIEIHFSYDGLPIKSERNNYATTSLLL